jgi:hypothetical protein
LDWEQDSWQDAKKKIKFFKRYLSRNFATQFKSRNKCQWKLALVLLYLTLILLPDTSG